MVTHDLREAVFFGDNIVLLRVGWILPRLLCEPAEEFLGRFTQMQRSPREAMEMPH